MENEVQTEGKYILFKGFKKINSFLSILEAKQNAPKEDGTYNLLEIGGPYRDSWIILNGQIYNQ